jgi:hypothetical protein
VAGASVLEESLVEDGSRWGVAEHHRFHVVEDVGLGRSVEKAHAALHAPQERAHRLAEHKFDVQHPRVAQRHHEGAHTPQATGKRETEVRPIHLHRRARRKVQRREGLPLRVGSNLGDPVGHEQGLLQRPGGIVLEAGKVRRYPGEHRPGRQPGGRDAREYLAAVVCLVSLIAGEPDVHLAAGRAEADHRQDLEVLDGRRHRWRNYTAK